MDTQIKPIELTDEEREACGAFISLNLCVDKGRYGLVAEVLRRIFVLYDDTSRDNFERKVVRFLKSDDALLPLSKEEKKIANQLVALNTGMTNDEAKTLIMRRRASLAEIKKLSA
jgi:hypothetical protein